MPGGAPRSGDEAPRSALGERPLLTELLTRSLPAEPRPSDGVREPHQRELEKLDDAADLSDLFPAISLLLLVSLAAVAVTFLVAGVGWGFSALLAAHWLLSTVRWNTWGWSYRTVVRPRSLALVRQGLNPADIADWRAQRGDAPGGLPKHADALRKDPLLLAYASMCRASVGEPANRADEAHGLRKSTPADG